MIVFKNKDIIYVFDKNNFSEVVVGKDWLVRGKEWDRINVGNFM